MKVRSKLAILTRVVLVSVLALSLSSVAITSAQASTRMTPYQLRQWAVGKQIGPNRYTYGGVEKIQSFNYIAATSTHRAYWNVNTSLYDGYGCTRCMTPISPDAQQRNTFGNGFHYMNGDWWNPISWDWGSIFGFVWDKVTACFDGALAGTVGTASGTLIVNLLARGGKVFVGPYGYAAIAVGGCVWSVVSS